MDHKLLRHQELFGKGLYKLLDYRVWNGERMVHRFDSFNSGIHPHVEMLPTGIKDKHGKEIYEGDIISGYCSSKRLYIIKHGFFEDDSCDYPRGYAGNGFYIQRIGEIEQCYPSTIAFGSADDDGQVTVVGNIYENKELLK